MVTSTDSALALPSLSSGPAGLVASLGLHAALLVALAVFVEPAAMPATLEQVVLVELVAAPVPLADAPSPAIPETGAPGTDSPDRPAADTPAAPPAASSGAVSEMIEATVLMAGAALADPRNAEARAMLPLIEDTLRREQVCGIEAMEQIRSRDPDFAAECVISYAFADPESTGDELRAAGATVLAGGWWFRLEYVCVLGADLASVTAFRYRIGERLSDAERDRLGLAPCQ